MALLRLVWSGRSSCSHCLPSMSLPPVSSSVFILSSLLLFSLSSHMNTVPPNSKPFPSTSPTMEPISWTPLFHRAVILMSLSSSNSILMSSYNDCRLVKPIWSLTELRPPQFRNSVDRHKSQKGQTPKLERRARVTSFGVLHSPLRRLSIKDTGTYWFRRRILAKVHIFL